MDSERSLARSTALITPDATEQRRQARQRFADLSEAFYLLADTDCPREKLENTARAMDRWADKLRLLGAL